MKVLCSAQPTRVATVAKAQPKALPMVGATLAAVAILTSNVAPAQAGLVEDLLAKSTENKALHDKQRKATSSANFARSFTVTQGLCSFPDNFLGCNIRANQGKVKFLSDDIKIECQGQEGRCASKAPGSFPPFMGV